jgi:hypothetical protein
VKKTIQDKINAIINMAQTSGLDYYAKNKKSTTSAPDSLSQAITNKKDAAIFLAELEACIKLANEE